MSAGRDGQGPLGGFLAADVGEVDVVPAGDGGDGFEVHVGELDGSSSVRKPPRSATPECVAAASSSAKLLAAQAPKLRLSIGTIRRPRGRSIVTRPGNLRIEVDASRGGQHSARQIARRCSWARPSRKSRLI